MEQLDFVNRANSEYIDQLYQRYRIDPRSVDERWRAFFAGFDAGGGRAGGNGQASAPSGESPHVLNLAIQDLVHSFRELGHFVADLDPLGHNRASHPLLELREFNLTPDDLDRVVGSGRFH